MEIAKILVSGVTASPVFSTPIPKGIIGAQIRFEYTDPMWETLVKTVVFRSDTTADILNAGDLVTIPSELVSRAGHCLYVGVYGVDGENNIAIPTLWANLGEIQGAADPSGDEGAEPQLPVWAQLDVRVTELENAPGSAVDAAEVTQILQDYLEENPVSGEKGEKGDPGPQGEPGQDGTSASHSWNGTVLTLTSASGTSSADLKGEKGEKGEQGLQGTDGTDGRILAQDTPPDDTSVLWIDTGDVSGVERAFANPLYGKRISFNGDSICAGSEADGTLGGYGKIIADRNSMVCQNIAKGGSTVTAEMYSSSGSAYGWLCRTIDSMDETADYAILEGGINDASFGSPMGAIIDGYSGDLDDTTYCGAFESMLKQLVLRFPGKKIGYIAVHTNDDDFASGSDSNYYAIAKKCCEKWGVSFCDLNNTLPPLGRIPELRTVYTVNGDGVHPTAEGYRKFYCDKIEAWLKTL